MTQHKQHCDVTERRLASNETSSWYIKQSISLSIRGQHLKGMNHDIAHQISGMTWRPKAMSTEHHLWRHTQLTEINNKNFLTSCQVKGQVCLLRDSMVYIVRRSNIEPSSIVFTNLRVMTFTLHVQIEFLTDNIGLKLHRIKQIRLKFISSHVSIIFRVTTLALHVKLELLID
jgi:hypothetical protein